MSIKYQGKDITPYYQGKQLSRVMYQGKQIWPSEPSMVYRSGGLSPKGGQTIVRDNMPSLPTDEQIRNMKFLRITIQGLDGSSISYPTTALSFFTNEIFLCTYKNQLGASVVCSNANYFNYRTDGMVFDFYPDGTIITREWDLTEIDRRKDYATAINRTGAWAHDIVYATDHGSNFIFSSVELQIFA